MMQNNNEPKTALSDEETIIVSGGIPTVERALPSEPTDDPENNNLIRYEKSFTCHNKQCSLYGIRQFAIASSDNGYKCRCSGCNCLW